MDVSNGTMRDDNYDHRHVQSILFPLKYTDQAAKRWLDLHGFKHDNVRRTSDHVRYQQQEVEEGLKYRIFKLPNSDIEYVLQYDD